MKPNGRYQWFVTGTDTDVGKTVVAAAIADGMVQLGLPVRYWKPVQTGTREFAPDAATVRSLSPPSVVIAPTRHNYARPLAPDQAASLERRPAPAVDELVEEYREMIGAGAPPHLIAEGAGGLLVPLNDQAETWQDFLQAVELTPIVVARTTLGTLNHTALTCQQLTALGLPPLAVVFNGEPNELNERSLQRMLPGIQIVRFPTIGALARGEQWSAATLTLARALTALAGERAAAGEREDWREADRDHCWHPFTQHAVEPEPLAVESARGAWLQLRDGRRVLDGIGSWWVNTLGHGRPEITTALAQQHKTLDHVLFAGACHEPAARLAETLVRLTHGYLERVFFSDDGSTAVEVALKMARQYWVNRGEPQRTRVVAFRGSYHGDTFGAMSVGAESGFFGPFAPFLFDVEWAEHPPRDAKADHPLFQNAADHLQKLLRGSRGEVACVIVEPLVQGAAGMRMHSERWLQNVATQCRKAGVPLVLDEVFTGFGRVGQGFAFERAGVQPDILCLSKALTGGSIPLAVTMASTRIFSSFLGDSKAQALLHGHSYTGNPIGCRAALAALDIYEREGLAERGRCLEDVYLSWLNEIPATWMESPRVLGSILAFELGNGKSNYFAGGGQKFAAAALDRGLFVRPLGNTVYLTPPLSLTEAQQKHALTALGGALEEWHRQAPGA